jgi:hypothetical protein
VNLPTRIRPGSAVRGGGIALACLVPGLPDRTRAVLASYGVGWPLDKPGLQLFVVTADDDAEPWKKVVFPFASSALSWTLVMTAAATAVRRAPLPAPVAALLVGAAVAVGDSAMVDLGEHVRARTAPSATPAETAT